MGIEATASVDLTWEQSQGVEPGGCYHVYDGDDLDSEINDEPIPAWPDREHKMGNGCGRNGRGRNGVGAGGYGNGQGRNGRGLNGHGGDVMTHRAVGLADAAHTLTVIAYDAAGNAAASGHASTAVVVRGTPAAPTDLSPGDYDDGDLSLTFDLSGDDDDA
ncbi:MAG TPA: hypothetical protein VMZ50_03855 [Phycisphaerae bacterium]|nr:hypothetical protein [Phycisphaerae bacterium]